MAMMDIVPLSDQTKGMVLAIMNHEHPDAIRVYVRHYAGKKQATHATLVDVDDKCISIRFKGKGSEQGDVTLPYVDEAGEPVTVRTVGDCRRALVNMARVAASALGEQIELPQPKPAPVASDSSTAPSTPELDFGPHRDEMQQIIQRLGAEQMPSPEEREELSRRLLQLKTAVEQGVAADTGGADSSSSSGGTVVRGGMAAPARHADLFKGEGTRLGSSTASASNVIPETSSAQLREVDPDKPVVRLRVQLLDRRPAQVMVNRDFTLQDLRAWLDHHQGAAVVKPYNLMEVTGFPPKKLSDFNASIQELGLNASSSLACRPA